MDKEMELLEKVEKIKEKTGVSYQEAKDALEAAGGDVLDALVYLENQGKAKKPEVDVYTTKAESSEEFREAAKKYEESTKETFGDHLKKFFVLGNQLSRIFYGAKKILRKLKKAFFVQKTILPFMESVEAVLGAKEQDV